MKTTVVIKNDINKALNKNGKFELLNTENVRVFETVAEAEAVCKENNLEVVHVADNHFYKKNVNENQVWIVETISYEEYDFEQIHEGGILTIKELVNKLSELDQEATTDIGTIVMNKVKNQVFID